MHLDLQLIHLLFTEASSEMVSMKGVCQEAILKERKQEKRLRYAK